MILFTSFVVHTLLCYKLLQLFKTRIINLIAIVYLVHRIMQITSIRNTISQQLLHLSHPRVNITWKLSHPLWTFDLALPYLLVTFSIRNAFWIASVYLVIELHVEVLKIEFELFCLYPVILLQLFLSYLVRRKI